MQRQNDPNAYGAAMTYGRRYALLCMFGLVTEDDDAASASTSLEKLLRELCACTDLDQLGRVKSEHFDKGMLTDKFCNKMYNTIHEKMHAHLSGMNQERL
jgi:hypothetical protein